MFRAVVLLFTACCTIWCVHSLHRSSLVMRAATGKAGKAGKAEKAHGKTSGFRSKDVSNTLLGVNLSSKYNVLSTKEIRLGRSELYDVVEIGGEGYKGPVRKAKIINDLVRYSRSKANYQKICGKTAGNEFIQVYENEEVAGRTKRYVSVMESGEIDVKRALAQSGPLRGKELRAVAGAMLKALTRVHKAGLVWTDLKIDNFVMTLCKPTDFLAEGPLESDTNYFSSKYQCKAIDLESSVSEGKPIVDFSPEVAAPEILDALSLGQMGMQSGRNGDYKLDLREPVYGKKALDVWALGVTILHLYTGKAPIVSRTDVGACLNRLQAYKDGKTDLGLGEVDDPKLKKILTAMLDKNPTKRPSVQFIALSQYFMT